MLRCLFTPWHALVQHTISAFATQARHKLLCGVHAPSSFVYRRSAEWWRSILGLKNRRVLRPACQRKDFYCFFPETLSIILPQLLLLYALHCQCKFNLPSEPSEGIPQLLPLPPLLFKTCSASLLSPSFAPHISRIPILPATRGENSPRLPRPNQSPGSKPPESGTYSNHLLD